MKYLKLFTLISITLGSSIHKHINHLHSGSGPLDTQLFVFGIVCISFSILLLWFNERRAAINSYRL